MVMKYLDRSSQKRKIDKYSQGNSQKVKILFHTVVSNITCKITLDLAQISVEHCSQRVKKYI